MPCKQVLSFLLSKKRAKIQLLFDKDKQFGHFFAFYCIFALFCIHIGRKTIPTLDSTFSLLSAIYPFFHTQPRAREDNKIKHQKNRESVLFLYFPCVYAQNVVPLQPVLITSEMQDQQYDYH